MIHVNVRNLQAQLMNKIKKAVFEINLINYIT